MTMRQDAWTPDEDLLLAELVLAHIREGSTQLKAFEEAGKKLKRTAAACGFRWNSNIRKQYKDGIEFAKKQRKESKKRSSLPPLDQSQEYQEVAEEVSNSTVMEAGQLFRKIENELIMLHQYKKENSRLEYEKATIEKRLEELSEEHNRLKADYQSLMSLLNKARKMADDLAE